MNCPLKRGNSTEWSYSDPGFVTLGRIIDVVSEQPFERFVDARIFKPLGMEDSFFFPPAGIQRRKTSRYILRDGTLSKSNGDLYPEGARYASPAFGINSTAPDMAAFCQMMLNGGTYHGVRILSRSSVEIMTAVHTGDLQTGYLAGIGWGLGWRVVREPLGTLSVASIGSFRMGSGRGFGRIDPAKDLVGVLLFQGAGAVEVPDTFMAMAAGVIID
ncbi:MAG: serine hydrolase [Bacteroidetes bacterium]|nr:serine hydrolase [Bacteroidota bacterium]